tara:strand:- start:1064 stop:1243 length:180 start_codon:yes stop_codon:yes gene_type:complete
MIYLKIFALQNTVMDVICQSGEKLSFFNFTRLNFTWIQVRLNLKEIMIINGTSAQQNGG